MEQSKPKACWPRILKNLSYCIAPILIAILMFSIISIIYAYEVVEIRDGKSYFDTDRFADRYLLSVYDKVNSINEIKKENPSITEGSYHYKIADVMINGKKGELWRYTKQKNFQYLIIDSKENIAYTNLHGDSIDEIKNTVLANKKYWCYENQKVTTSIPQLEQNKLQRISTYGEITKNNSYVVYTALDNSVSYYDQFFEENMVYTVAQKTYQFTPVIIPICIILLIAMIPVVLVGIGKTSKQEGIYLNWFDKLPIEIAMFLVAFFGSLFGVFSFQIGLNIAAIVSIIFATLGILILYLSAIILLETIVKRLKTHTFIKTTFAYWVYKKLQYIFNNFSISWKVALCFTGFAIANVIIFGLMQGEPFIGLLLFMGLYIPSFLYALKRAAWLKQIIDAVQKIYEGNTKIHIDERTMKGTLKKVAIHVNDIAGGFSNAVNEQLKSERLKTELITNVSHDIKTPLTSIINYVDLLKKEDISSKKAQEYLGILDNKSQRLKKLTEDLVEASKASSGAIKLNKEKLDVSELIKQVSGEFEDKFKANNLEEIITFPKNQVFINADSRYMYRVLENMYSNVSKYAMSNTRVYTDIIEHGNNVIIQIKNVSKEKLNITADELMQRFVRGDSSRNTEGSGLGLSIAMSLTELQGGQFHIYLDGDLFKVTIGFKKMQ